MTSRVVASPPASPDPTLRHALRFVARTFQSQLQKRIERFGVSEAEYIVLFTLRRLNELSSAEISRWTGVTPQGGNQIVKALVDRGLAYRAPSPTHGRILLIGLTAEGRRVIEACVDEANDLEAQMCAEMTDHDRDRFVELLHLAAAGLGAPIAPPREEQPPDDEPSGD